LDNINIFGIKIHNTNLEEVSEKLKIYLEGKSLKTIYTPNTEIIMEAKDNENLKKIINNGDLVLPDGIGLVYGSRIKGRPLEMRVTGFDTSIRLLEIGDEYGYGIYLLGGKDGVAKDASINIKKEYEGIKVLGCHSGYFQGSHLGIEDSQEEEQIIDDINNKSPDIIFVGLGFPRQEIWIDRNKNKLKGKIIIGNGGVIDVLSGRVKRAPIIYQRLGLEWLYRLIQEPSRIKRQIALPKFIWEVLFNKNIIK